VTIGMIPPNGKNRWGGLLGQLDSQMVSAPFEIVSLPAGASPQQDAMGATRWLWRWYPDQLTSMSNVDGTGFTIFAHISQSLLILDLPVAIGNSFLFSVLEQGDAGSVVEFVGSSDGVATLQPFIVAPQGSWAGSPSYANSHLVWARGINPKDINTFDSVELWASEFSDDPTKLQPYKVDAFLYASMPYEYVGGWGYYATGGLGDGGPRPRETVLWNLETKARRSIFLPDDRETFAYPGISRTHLWMVARRSSDMLARYLMRFAL
jgi:hypothetical protein